MIRKERWVNFEHTIGLLVVIILLSWIGLRVFLLAEIISTTIRLADSLATYVGVAQLMLLWCFNVYWVGQLIVKASKKIFCDQEDTDNE